MTVSQAETASARLLDGKTVAQHLQTQTAAAVSALKAQGLTPALRVIQVGNNPASSVYVKKKATVARQLGIDSDIIHLPETIQAGVLKDVIVSLNEDPSIHAILLQLPLPGHLDPLVFQELTDPRKDVDGFHPVNLGRLLAGATPYSIACTPYGCLHLLRTYQIPMAGQQAVILGRSNIVGKPMAHLLLQQQATVTICHSRTRDLAEVVRQADIVVAATGQPLMVQADWLKPGATVLDVGINRTEAGTLVGDVDFAQASQVAGAITPVPGGVGPLTIAMLMHNTVNLCRQANGLPAEPPEVSGAFSS